MHLEKMEFQITLRKSQCPGGNNSVHKFSQSQINLIQNKSVHGKSNKTKTKSQSGVLCAFLHPFIKIDETKICRANLSIKQSLPRETG
ncbi:hypothetical protein GDO78_018730 [Eleutherodactylus coqui]|uniref:Uncharacterized protein n=1 Tax=Eleutherodactylus coqui TaxID=57060 RepID=A0A8J6AZC2_ELECQ|nr:hypothetical protein GDO78_018730 [Eleutherodactylus coqui]